MRFYNIIFTKIGVDELYGVSSDMFDFLQKHMTYIRKEKDVNKPKEGLLLTQIVVLTVFALHYCIEGSFLTAYRAFMSLIFNKLKDMIPELRLKE